MLAYFCSEFALETNLKTYAGGLGILAGDLIRQLADDDRPSVGVGLYYYKGYLAQKYDWHTPESKGLTLLIDAEGKELRLSVPIGEREVKFRTWIYSCKKVKIYLLDALVDENDKLDQHLSYHLYDQDIRTRIAQQMLLGIGGVRLLKYLQVPVTTYHMNEGHAVFLSLESDPHVPIVFTNHTVIPEGNHMYAYELVRSIFARYVAQNQNFDLDQLLKDGACQYENTFSLTHLAIKKSKIMNGVSHLHTLKLALQYPHASPISVTNGVHVPTWDMVGDDDIHLAHDKNKKKLLDHIKKVTGQDWSPDMLLVTWSRRIVQYKRPLALFENVIRLRKILSEGGARIIIAGIPHPQDAWANDALKHILAFVSNELKGLVVYLPEYNPDVSRMLVGGSDIWLNTPIVGLEACGTSGMKAALNGVLNVSTRDGWMAEATLEEIGWPLDDTTVSSDIYLTLLTEVIPLWKAVLSGNTKDWWCMMETARSLIQQSFSAKRMVEDYARIWS